MYVLVTDIRTVTPVSNRTVETQKKTRLDESIMTNLPDLDSVSLQSPKKHTEHFNHLDGVPESTCIKETLRHSS